MLPVRRDSAGTVQWTVTLFAVALFACSGVAPTRSDGVLPLDIGVRARGVHAGEPVRIDVHAVEALTHLEGSFLGRPVFFVPDDDGKRWSGWTIVDLDGKPGRAAVEVRGRSADGRIAAGTRAVTIGEHEFPREELSVAPRYVEPPAEARERLADERRRLAELYLSRRPVSPARTAFLPPVPGEPTSVFGTRRLYNGEPRSPHPGLDLRAATGTPVLASGAGVVGLAEDLYYSGNTVIVDHGGGLFTLYAHLSELLVHPGQTVGAGERIGHSGATGRVTGPHLHWGGKIGDLPFDPRALLDPRLFDDSDQ